MTKALIITGGSKGIGKATALEFQKNGYHVFSLSRTINEELAEITQIPFDLSDLPQIKTAFFKVLKQIKYFWL